MPTEGGRSKAPHKKVRTGCGTCKIRKVKCDEAKPFCKRCISTGITCDGYTEPPPRKERARRSKYTIDPEDTIARRPQSLDSLYNGRALYPSSADNPPVVSRPSTFPWPPPIASVSYNLIGDADEQRSFYYFRHQAVHNISGYFELAFWDYLVLQACYTVPCVRHALLALSALHESYEVVHLRPHLSARERAASLNTLALKQYSKAITLLASDMSIERHPLQVILTSCLIFIWIEFIQDNVDTAISHLKSGLKLLQEPRTCNVDESVSRLFTRLRTQVTVHGNAKFDNDTTSEPISYVVPSPQPQIFLDIFDARCALDNEFAKIYRFHRQFEDPDVVQYHVTHHPFPDPLSLEAICQAHIHNLQQWKLAFRQTLATPPCMATQEKQAIALAQLELQYLFVENTLQTLFTTSQMIYDNFETEFRRMLSLAESLISQSREKFYIFAFDTGSLFVLLYVILKCRNLAVRQKAVQLLKQAPPREGIWDRESVMEVAEWKIGKEEQGRAGLPLDAPLPNNARTYAESARETTVDGRKMTLIRYKRGADQPGDEDHFEEEITTISTRLAGVLAASGCKKFKTPVS